MEPLEVDRDRRHWSHVAIAGSGREATGPRSEWVGEEFLDLPLGSRGSEPLSGRVVALGSKYIGLAVGRSHAGAEPSHWNLPRGGGRFRSGIGHRTLSVLRQNTLTLLVSEKYEDQYRPYQIWVSIYGLIKLHQAAFMTLSGLILIRPDSDFRIFPTRYSCLKSLERRWTRGDSRGLRERAYGYLSTRC
jgi:hypothetical protein